MQGGPPSQERTVADQSGLTRSDSLRSPRPRTSRRASAVAANKKINNTETITLSSSDLSDVDSEPVRPKARPSARDKGKGKAKQHADDDDEDELSSAKTVPSSDEGGDYAMDDYDEEDMLARALKASITDTIARNPKVRLTADRIKKEVNHKLHKPRKSRSSTASSAKGKANHTKGKGKAVAKAASDDDLSDDDDVYEPDVESSVGSILDEEHEEFLSNESEPETEEDKPKSRWGKKRLVTDEDRANRPPPRKGATISAEDRKGMKKMTQGQKNQLQLQANHPELTNCWAELAATPVTEVERAVQPEGLTQKLLPFQLEGLNWMMRAEKGRFGGGFLCDEMGMGKTIQTISLILSDHDPNDHKCTLVLAPTVAIVQWRNEIAKFTEGFKVLVYHGTNRADSAAELEKYDVVLTSYAVMESTFRREHKGFQRKGKLMKEDSIIHKVKWHRVILDEAHNIKDRQSNTAKAAFALQAQYRWCLSGTPLQNRVGELYSLVRFVGCDPFAHYMCKKCDCKSLHWLSNLGACSECGHSGMQHVCYWNNEVLKPIQYGGASSGEGLAAFEKLNTLLRRLMLRRTKVERADDLGLPPRVVKVRRDYFTEEEEELYKSLFQDVKRKFNTYADEGTVLNNYSNIFTLITRMRQLADHPDLVIKSRTSQAIQHAPADLPQDIITCRICLDEAEDAVKTASCRHIFCRECIRQFLETATVQAPDCPVCNQPISIDLDQEAIEQDDTNRQGFLSRIDPTKARTSTKIEALLEELSKLKSESSTQKSIVFSQFTSMLDLVARRLQLGGFKFVRLQGSMTPTARDNTIQAFMNSPECTVFLISLKAGGVALNLTEASSVFLLDPWWNPAVELQAMDRIHRLGQHRPITVTRLIIENSIESRILDLQRKKENLAASALGDDDKAMGRLTPDDLRFLFQL